MLNSWKRIVRRKKAAAYQVKRSAVKKIQKEKSGMAKISEIIPAPAANFESLLISRRRRIIKKIISCGFIYLYRFCISE